MPPLAGEKWRQVYKSLLVLDHLLKNGPQVVVNELQGNVDTIEFVTLPIETDESL